MAARIKAAWNRQQVQATFGTREQCIQWAEEHDFLPKTKLCPKHNSPCTLRLDNSAYGIFRCRKPHGGSKSEWSRAEGTWFEGVRVPLPTLFQLMYSFTARETVEKTMIECVDKTVPLEERTVLSSKTVCEWFSFCREVVVSQQVGKEAESGKIGGQGETVQIDESKFGKRKYNKGRRVEGHWVIGMIQDGSEDLRLEVCPDNVRSTDALLPLIQKHVEVGSTVCTDYWRAYDCLSLHGYIHQKVNHSDSDRPWVNPQGYHTQRIESTWRVVKQFFGGKHITKEMFADYLVMYQWFRRCVKNEQDPFQELLEAVREFFGTQPL